MKILKYGHIKPASRKCASCGAVFEYVPKDVTSKCVGGKELSIVYCPVCGRHSVVKTGPTQEGES